MPFICMPTVPNKTDEVLVQITDLFPHKNQSNATLTPNFQGPRYHRAIFKGDLVKTVVLGADFTVTTKVAGLSAYLISTIEVTSDANSIGLTPVQADAIANAIIGQVGYASALTTSAINTLIQATTGDGGDVDGIGKGNSTATVLEILQILSGSRVYTLPATTDLGNEDANNVFIPLDANIQASFFSTPVGTKDVSSADASFFTSARSGQIKLAQSKKTTSGVASPVLVAYNDDGSLIQ